MEGEFSPQMFKDLLFPEHVNETLGFTEPLGSQKGFT